MTQHQTVGIDGLHCAACVGRAERLLARVPGVVGATVALTPGQARLEWSGPPDLGAVAEALDRGGYGLRETTTRLVLDGLTCASCVMRAETALSAVPGVHTAQVNLAEGRAVVRHAALDGISDALIAALEGGGWPAHLETAAQDDPMAQEEAAMRRRFLQAGALTLPVFVLEMGGHAVPAFHHWLHMNLGTGPLWTLQAVLTTLVLAFPGRVFLTRGLPALIRRAPDMNSLVALGTLAAWAYSMVVLLAPAALPEGARAVYFEAAAVIVTLILMGRWLEARARGRSGAAIRALVALQPDTALVESEAGVEERPSESLRAGDILRLRPGTRIAADGVVLSGESFVDESMLTGEPVPVAKQPGSAVTGGTLNGTGSLRVQVQRTGSDTVLARILTLVRDAQMGKLPIQALVDRVTLRFVPAVLVIAVVATMVWLALGPSPSQALVAGVSVLIVACPCAMGLATPTSILVGSGRAAELGVLFRRGEALQRLAGVRGMAFDKTGTLTLGRPRLTAIDLAGVMSEAEALAAAAALEGWSEHPLARAICAEAEVRGLESPTPEAVKAHPGRGLEGRLNGALWRIGSARFMSEAGLELPDALRQRAQQRALEGQGLFWLAREAEVIAALTVSDPVRPEAAAAVSRLKALGLEVAMISGDAAATAEAVGRELGITRVISGVLPEGKVAALAELPGFGFTGDGINDAPALAAAKVGLAMGSGTDVAIEAADVVLVRNDPGAVVHAVEMSRATMRNIKQNLFWAFGYNTALIPVAAGLFYPWFGWQLSPMLAAAAMALSSVFVVGNALRLRYAVRRPAAPGPAAESLAQA